MGAASTSGYSGTPLGKKLGIVEGTRLLPIESPPDYLTLLGSLPPNVSLVTRMSGSVDIVHLFSVRRADLERRLEKLRGAIRPDATVWVSWPKKMAKVPTDITEDVIRAVALPMGFVDVKVCAVSDVWSGLKLVIRKELR